MLIINGDDIAYDGDIVLYDGQPFSGIIRAQHLNQALEMEYEYLNGFEEGLCKEWYPSGQLSRRFNAVRGLIEGKEHKWHENGAIKSIADYLHGAALLYDEWDDTGMPVAHRELDRQSGLFKYVSSLPPRS